jgi:surface antigen
LQQVGTAPVGQLIPWSDPDTGSKGTFEPTAAEYTDPTTGQICRPISASYYINGHQPVEGDTGNVCRTPNGDWQRQTTASTGTTPGTAS